MCVKCVHACVRVVAYLHACVTLRVFVISWMQSRQQLINLLNYAIYIRNL